MQNLNAMINEMLQKTFIELFYFQIIYFKTHLFKVCYRVIKTST